MLSLFAWPVMRDGLEYRVADRRCAAVAALFGIAVMSRLI
jgi:hypothetical protein